MTLQTALGGYVAAGIVGVLIGIGVDGSRGFGATAGAWILCLATFARPPRRPRVAEIPLGSKIFRDRSLWLGAMPIRLLLVLVTAAAAYSWLGERLGLGFWFALLAFYLIGLALSVAWTLSGVQRGD